MKTRDQKNSRTAEKFGKLELFGLVFVLIWTLFVLGVSVWATALTDVYRTDGAFQTASALFRLRESGVYGSDFFSFFGPGISLFLFPLFHLLGADFEASAYASHLVVRVYAVAAGTLLALLVLGKRSLLPSLMVAASLVFLALFDDSMKGGGDWVGSPLVGPLDWWLDPGASLRPLRTLPALILGTLFFVSRRASIAVRVSSLGAVSGAILALWSIDYSVVSVFWVWAVLGLVSLVRKSRPEVLEFLAFPLVTTLAFLFSLALVTNGHLLETIKYQFVDVRLDQFWFWEPADASERVASPGQLVGFLVADPLNLLALGIIASFVISLWRNYSTRVASLMILAGSLFTGGVAATVGGYVNPEYMIPSHTFSLVFLVLSVLRVVVMRVDGVFKLVVAWRGFLLTALSVTLSLTSIGALGSQISQISPSDAASAMGSSQKKNTVDIASFYSESLQIAERLGQREVFEEYWGPISSTLPRGNSSFELDSIIHARGDFEENLESYLLTEADVVVTLNPTSDNSAWYWTSWNLSANWNFYRTLFENYELKYVTPTDYFWERSNSVEPGPPARQRPCVVLRGEVPLLQIGSGPAGLYSLGVSVSESTGSRTIVKVGNFLNIPGSGYTSLNPNSNYSSLPLFVSGKSQDLEIRTEIGDMKILDCELTGIAPSRATEMYFPTAIQNGLLIGYEFKNGQTAMTFSFPPSYGLLSAMKASHFPGFIVNSVELKSGNLLVELIRDGSVIPASTWAFLPTEENAPIIENSSVANNAER